MKRVVVFIAQYRRLPAKNQANLHIRAVLQEPSLFAHIIYGAKGSFRRVENSFMDLRKDYKLSGTGGFYFY